MNVFFDKLFRVDWQTAFVPDASLLEMFLRGSVMYWVMFALLRIFRRQAGSIGIADLLVIVVIADAAQNGMAGDSKSITESIVLVCTIVFWDYIFDWLGYKSKFFERILEPRRLKLIEDGRYLRVNMRKELITVDELARQLREQGIKDVSRVEAGYLESDGHFSFIRKDDGEVR
jgi:uncharacterized membrane protein YcaP (DUF421 family)